ncbi:hypothetical protein AVEN_231601-1 [Araneus ventricosus]|uniref:Uncharacterized protein n=1 Tax=Araneus ventricosus TaxID=182803 RepID=A0A4Y2VLI7_ARAVE|nr:hypothetical protein AVEN_231601-1 [Araneus ventricosus]
MAPGLAPLSFKTSSPQQREDVWLPTYDLACGTPNIRRIICGIRFEPGTLRPKAEALALGHRGLPCNWITAPIPEIIHAAQLRPSWTSTLIRPEEIGPRVRISLRKTIYSGLNHVF